MNKSFEEYWERTKQKIEENGLLDSPLSEQALESVKRGLYAAYVYGKSAPKFPTIEEQTSAAAAFVEEFRSNGLTPAQCFIEGQRWMQKKTAELTLAEEPSLEAHP